MLASEDQTRQVNEMASRYKQKKNRLHGLARVSGYAETAAQRLVTN